MRDYISPLERLQKLTQASVLAHEFNIVLQTSAKTPEAKEAKRKRLKEIQEQHAELLK